MLSNRKPAQIFKTLGLKKVHMSKVGTYGWTQEKWPSMTWEEGVYVVGLEFGRWLDRENYRLLNEKP